jgi:hypothetical protein
MPFGAERIDAARQIAEATVVNVRSASADVTLRYSTGHSQVPEGAFALPVRKGLRRWTVRIEGAAPLAGEVRSKLAGSRFVREAANEDTEPPLATVHLSGDKVVLLDRTGLPLVPPRPADRAAVADLSSNLDTLARAQHLLSLETK